MRSRFRHVFGPVPSRRLGRSLGVDLVPFKTCTYDCIYCQLGRTTRKTMERKEWVPLDPVVEEVRARLSSRPDFITLSGSGEPTLHSGIGDLISRLKGLTKTPVAVLTNGSLLPDREVRSGLLEADLVIPSLDAGGEALFRRVNRPCPGIRFGEMVEGLATFGAQYRGELWLEVFLLDGLTALPGEVRKIAKIARRLSADRVQLNTVARPPAERRARAVPPDRLMRLASLFQGGAEAVADFRGRAGRAPADARPEDVLDFLRRRPATIRDLAGGLGMNPNEAVKLLDVLARKNLVRSRRVGGRPYFSALAPELPETPDPP